MVNRTGKRGRFGLHDRRSRRIDTQDKAARKSLVILDEYHQVCSSRYIKMINELNGTNFGLE